MEQQGGDEREMGTAWGVWSELAWGVWSELASGV